MQSFHGSAVAAMMALPYLVLNAPLFADMNFQLFSRRVALIRPCFWVAAWCELVNWIHKRTEMSASSGSALAVASLALAGVAAYFGIGIQQWKWGRWCTLGGMELLSNASEEHSFDYRLLEMQEQLPHVATTSQKLSTDKTGDAGETEATHTMSG